MYCKKNTKKIKTRIGSIWILTYTLTAGIKPNDLNTPNVKSPNTTLLYRTYS